MYKMAALISAFITSVFQQGERVKEHFSPVPHHSGPNLHVTPCSCKGSGVCVLSDHVSTSILLVLKEKLEDEIRSQASSRCLSPVRAWAMRVTRPTFLSSAFKVLCKSSSPKQTLLFSASHWPTGLPPLQLTSRFLADGYCGAPTADYL